MKRHILFTLAIFVAVMVLCFATQWFFHPLITLAGFCAILRYAWYVIDKEISKVDLSGVNF